MEANLPPVLILGDHLDNPDVVADDETAYYLHTLPALRDSDVELHACFLRGDPVDGLDHALATEPAFLAASGTPLVAMKVAGLIREKGCGIVHACGGRAALVARIAARMTGARAILHVFDPQPPSTATEGLHRMFAGQGDIGLVVSRSLREMMVHGYHLDPAQVRVLHSALPAGKMREATPEDRARARAALGLPDCAEVMAMIAPMQPVKGHRAMLSILSRVVAERPRAVLLVAGDGPERAACEALADKLDLGAHVRFLGDGSDVEGVLAAADLLAVPSRSEGLPMMAIQASAAGRPTVGFDGGGLRDIVSDRVSGRLVPPGNETAFARALIELLASRETLARHGRAALAAARRFSIESHVDELVACYGNSAPRRMGRPSLQLRQAG